MASRAEARSTYFPKASGNGKSYGGMSPGLLRARQPFVVRNVVTGAGVFLFAASVYFYSIKAVSQDDFSGEDVKALQAEQEAKRRANSLSQPNSTSSLLVGPSAAAQSSSSVADLRTKQSASAQAVVDLESSILGAGPIGTRGDSLQTGKNTRKTATSYFELTTDKIFLGRQHSRDGLPTTFSLDRPGKVGDKPPSSLGDRRLV